MGFKKTNKNKKRIKIIFPQKTYKNLPLNNYTGLLKLKKPFVALKILHGVIFQVQKIINFYHSVTKKNMFLATLQSKFTGLKVPQKTFFFLIKFKNRQLQLNLTDQNQNHNYVSLSAGLVMSKFTTSKATKKALPSRFILMRFMRKLLLLLGIFNLSLVIKGLAFDIHLLVDYFQRKVPHVYYNPMSSSFINEETREGRFINVWSLSYKKIATFNKQKSRKKGRVKRKVFRKLSLKNNLVD